MPAGDIVGAKQVTNLRNAGWARTPKNDVASAIMSASICCFVGGGHAQPSRCAQGRLPQLFRVQVGASRRLAEALPLLRGLRPAEHGARLRVRHAVAEDRGRPLHGGARPRLLHVAVRHADALLQRVRQRDDLARPVRGEGALRLPWSFGRPVVQLVGLRLQGVSRASTTRPSTADVVAHGAPYVTPSKAGRSEGCPAMEPARAKQLLPKLAEGGMVFLFAPDQQWMQHDPWVSAERRMISQRR